MSQSNGNFDIFDPTGMFKTMRDANVESWAKMMVQLVNSEAYAQANGAMLDAWLTSSGPFRKAIEASMAQLLASLNLPSRSDFISLAERINNMEMRLDDLDAKLDEALRNPVREASTKRDRRSGKATATASETKPSTEEDQL